MSDETAGPVFDMECSHEDCEETVHYLADSEHVVCREGHRVEVSE